MPLTKSQHRAAAVAISFCRVFHKRRQYSIHYSHEKMANKEPEWGYYPLESFEVVAESMLCQSGTALWEYRDPAMAI